MILPIDRRQEFDLSGAVDLESCPRRAYRTKRCFCGEICARCYEPKHMAIHGPFLGEKAGSVPFGHRFVPRDKRGTDNSNTARLLIENASVDANKRNGFS
jgi:hypothetical protein